MGTRTSPPQDLGPRGQPADPGSGPKPCHQPQTPPGTTLNIGPILALTVRHFFPQFNDWIDQIPDPRFQPFVIYHKRFLLWWGLTLFLCKLSSRRQLDFQCNTDGPYVLDNLNRLAGTQQQTRPVHDTLDYFLGRSGVAGVFGLRTLMMRHLLRMKVLDSARLLGHVVAATDGTGYLVFNQRHCPHCLTRQCGSRTLYMHQALEAKLLGPADTVLSMGTAFIDNRDRAELPVGASVEQQKQDCELKALRRLGEQLRHDYPQLRLCLSGDALFGCGEGLQIAKDYRFDYVYVFKEGRLPTVWADFQGLLPLVPEQRVELWTPQGTKQVYRWINELSYRDSANRPWQFNAVQCEQTTAEGEQTLWAWVTNLPVNRNTVIDIATKGGRQRWHIENQGFNTQKNSDLNLEHAYSRGPHWAAYYVLLQLAHLLLQLVEKGSLLKQLAAAVGQRVLGLYGSLKNMAYRLLESLRQLRWPDAVYDAKQAGRIQIRLDSS